MYIIHALRYFALDSLRALRLIFIFFNRKARKDTRKDTRKVT